MGTGSGVAHSVASVGRTSRWTARATATATALAAIVGAGTLAGFLGRLAWPLELACHFRVHYIVALLALALVLALGRHRIRVFACLLLAALNGVVVLPLWFPPESPRSMRGEPLRALVANVYFRNRDTRRTLELIRSRDPEIVLLEEVTSAWRDAVGELRRRYPHALVEVREDNFGIALLSRHPFQSAEIVRVGAAGLPSVVARVTLGDAVVTLVGTHPSIPIGGRSAALRDDQLRAIAELVAGLEPPVILLGDLNTTPWSPVFADLLEKTGLRDSARGFGVQPTWPTQLGPAGIPIDHCLHSPGVIVVDRSTGPPIGSDHRPLLVDLVVTR